jgi:hypothetical protein
MTKARVNADNASADIQGVTAGTGLTGGGTSGTVTLTNDMATAMTTKGDLVVATGSGTYVRQGVGTNGQVLTADSAQADGVIWATPAASGMTNPMTTTGDTIYSSSGSTPARLPIGSSGQVLTVSGGIPSWGAAPSSNLTVSQIATGTLSGSSVTLSGLSSYDDLYLRITNVTGSGARFRMRPNNTISTVYDQVGFYVSSGGSGRIDNQSSDQFETGFDLRSGGTGSSLTFRFTNCRNAGFTNVASVSGYPNPASQEVAEAWQGVFRSSAAISSLTVSYATGSFTGGSYVLYGG